MEGDVQKARKFLELASAESANRSLKKAARGGHLECLDLLIGSMGHGMERLDRFDLAVALSWASGRPALGNPRARACLERLAGLAQPGELAWALREACSGADAQAAQALMDLGADPRLVPPWPRADGNGQSAAEFTGDGRRLCAGRLDREKLALALAAHAGQAVLKARKQGL